MSSKTQLSANPALLIDTNVLDNSALAPSNNVNSTASKPSNLNASYKKTFNNKLGLSRVKTKQFKRLVSVSGTALLLAASGPVISSLSAVALSPFATKINTPAYQDFVEQAKKEKINIGYKSYILARETLRSFWFTYPEKIDITRIDYTNFSYIGQKKPLEHYNVSVYSTTGPQALSLGGYNDTPNYFKIKIYDNTKVQLILDPKQNFRIDSTTINKSVPNQVLPEYHYEFAGSKAKPGPYKFQIRNPYTGETKDIVYQLDFQPVGELRYGGAFTALILSLIMWRTKVVRREKRIEKEKRNMTSLFNKAADRTGYDLGQILSEINARIPAMCQEVLKSDTVMSFQEKEIKVIAHFFDRVNENVYWIDKTQSVFAKDKNMYTKEYLNELVKEKKIARENDAILEYIPQFAETIKSSLDCTVEIDKVLKFNIHQGLLLYALAQPEEEFKKIMTYLKSDNIEFYNHIFQDNYYEEEKKNKDSNFDIKTQSAINYLLHKVIAIDKRKSFLELEHNPVIEKNILSLLKDYNYPCTHNNHVLNCFVGTTEKTQAKDLSQEILNTVLEQYTTAQLKQYLENVVLPNQKRQALYEQPLIEKGLGAFSILIEKQILNSSVKNLLGENNENVNVVEQSTPKKRKVDKI